MGCEDALTLVGTVEVAPGVHTIHVCVNERCTDGELEVRELEVGHCVDLEGDLTVRACIGRPIPPELPPSMYTREFSVDIDPTQAATGHTVTMSFAAPDGITVAEVEDRVEFEPQYLNGGPECGVTCRVAEVEF